MAVRLSIISDFQDQGIKNAKLAFGKFKTAVHDAEGGLGKFKAGAASVFDSVKANAGVFALGAGAAVGAFAVKAIGDFKDLALAADEFANKTGLTVAEASRWKEVAGDLNVEQEALETTIGKLNKTLGANPDLFRDLGVDIEYAKDGSVDVNETFLNTIQHLKDIKDPAERARQGAQLLGKGWQSMANLIQVGSADLTKSLEQVSGAKVIDPAEVRKAKEYRDAMDNLTDSLGDIALTVGQALIPVLTTAAGWIKEIVELGDFMGGVLQIGTDDIVSKMDAVMKAFDDNNTAIDNTRLELEDFGVASINAALDADKLSISVDAQKRYVDNVNTAWETLKGTLNLEQSISDANTQLESLKEKAIAAYGGSEEAVKEYTDELRAAKLMVIDLADTVNVSAKNQEKIKILVDKGDLEEAVHLIEMIGNAADGGKIGREKARALGPGFAPRAAGGPVIGGTTYLVGEKGPELFTPGASGNITPNNALGGGGNTINITVTSADPNAVVRALQSYNRNIGKLPVSVQ